MVSRLLIAAAVLAATTQAGWSADKAKKKKKTPDAAAPASKWEYKLTRADELVPKDTSPTSTTGSPGAATATTDDAKGRLADALNRLGEEGWELVWVDAPPRSPVGGGTGAMPGGAAGGFGGAPGGFGTAPGLDIDRVWQSVAGGKENLDLNDPDNKPVRDRWMSRGQKMPDDGILTKAMYKEYLDRRQADQQAATRRATGAPTPGALYYFKRAKG